MCFLYYLLDLFFLVIGFEPLSHCIFILSLSFPKDCELLEYKDGAFHSSLCCGQLPFTWLVNFLVDWLVCWLVCCFLKIKSQSPVACGNHFSPYLPFGGHWFVTFPQQVSIGHIVFFVFLWLPCSVCLDSRVVLLCYILLCFYKA